MFSAGCAARSDHAEQCTQAARQTVRVTRGDFRRIAARIDDQRVDVAVKRWREPAWRRRLLGRWSSRAACQWHRAHALLARDIATPQPLACLELPCAAGAAESVLIARWEHDAVDLHRRAWALAGLPAKTRRQAADRAAVALGQLVGRLHFWRIAHRDLKWCNLLITADEAPRALVTDLDGLRLPGRWRMALATNYLRRSSLNLARIQTEGSHPASWSASRYWQGRPR